ncbi:MAG: nicotinate-nucleotide adenylyltransferase [Clostridia bacterium]|jgi:nicotinate-nucleotide adenylyltransferase|nr:nicotinate-nucleotide adenylyltransferase [Clostridia bacterium]
MTNTVKRLGIMGGTFDPIHYGHLVTAEAARSRFQLDEVVFVPAGHPPHKQKKKVTDAQHRYMMTLLATVTNPYFKISDIEIARGGISYTYDTVRFFKEKYNGKLEVFFITGADAVSEIMTWKKIDSLIRECNFIAATRPGYSFDNFTSNNVFPQLLISKLAFLEVPALAISSTDVRRRVENSEPIKYLLPETVETYIYKNALYEKEGK